MSFIELIFQGRAISTCTLAGLNLFHGCYFSALRFCDKCQHIKPDRAHHCSVCGECVLKMDHHCPWVNNCVCFPNYKFFILFLGYSLIYCLFISLSSLEYFILFWKVTILVLRCVCQYYTVSCWQGRLEGNGRFHILFLFFVALMFAISLISLFCYHCYLVVHNRSTLGMYVSWSLVPLQFTNHLTPTSTVDIGCLVYLANAVILI